MKTLYTIGELASLLGMSAQTIRKYEKLGLINSVRQDNNYRSFEAPDITLLMRIKLYRNLGFSLKEIQVLLEEGKTEQGLGLYTERNEALNREIDRLNMLISCARTHENFLAHKDNDVGKIAVEQRPAMVGLIYRQRRSIVPRFLKDGVLAQLLEYMPPFQYMITVEKNCFYEDTNDYSVGFAVPKEFLQFVPETDDMFEIPSRVCVSVLVKHEVKRIDGQWEHISIRDDFEQLGVHRFMEENSLRLKDDITGFTYYDTIGPDIFTHYIKYWFPVF